MANNIIDSIKLSGTVYTLSAQTEGGGVPESTFTAYTASTNERISQDEEVTAAALNVLNESLSGKQDTLSAGTNITISGNVISAEGGGKAIEAGRGISVTTGETADTVSFSLPISAGTGFNTLLFQGGKQTSGNAQRAVAFGQAQIKSSAHNSAAFGTSYAEAQNAFAEGGYCHAAGPVSHAEGLQTTAYTEASHAEGNFTEAKNFAEHASGRYNVSSKASTTFGDSGNTLFSVGNGESNNARHNAFEIRQNGDIYLTSGGTDIKLQDHLGGGGSVTVDTELDSGSTNPVENRVIYNKIDEVEEVTAAGLNALNDKITPTVELTQAEYDALTTKDPNTYYIITDAQAVDLTNYYTKTETNTLLGGKQATLVSGTNIKTINNESILGSGNIDIKSGKAIEAGRGIAITTGETADTVSFNLPISANTDNSIVMGGKANNSFTNNGRDCLMVGSELTTNNGSDFSLVVGYRCSVNGDGSAVIGYRSRSTGDTCFAFGYDVSATTSHSFATGYGTITKNNYEHTSGKYNVSNTGSTTADKTLFSVGNGTSNNARHNAFEIRQNGDIYISSGGTDIKLQDNLGGGSSITVDSSLDSGSTNPVENRVIYNKIDEVEQVTAAGLNALNDNFGGLKLVKLSQAEYNALATKDSSTLYIIVN